MYARRPFFTPSLIALGCSTPLACAALAHDEPEVFVRLQTPKRELFVGESIPVQVEVGAPHEMTAALDSPPILHGDGFMLGLLSTDPERHERLIDGRRFSVMIWHSVLESLKPGSLSLTLEAALTVVDRAPTAPEPLFADEIGAAQSFADPAVQSLMQIHPAHLLSRVSPPMAFNVLPLPTVDRPAGFTGAVGHFAISSETSKSDVELGDPVVLRMHVQGTGNFDRVTSPTLDGVQQWRVFKPQAAFAPGDATGYRGDKVFEQPLIATQAGLQTLPALTFSYFDPEVRRYRTAHAAPLTVHVTSATAGRPGSTAARSAKATVTATATATQPTQSGKALLPGVTASVLLLCVFGAGLFAKVRSRKRAPADTASGATFHSDALSHSDALLHRNTRAHSADEWRARMDEACRRGDSAAFFTAASHVLALASQGLAMAQAAREDVATVHDASAEAPWSQFYALAEATRYGDSKVAPAELARWHAAVTRFDTSAWVTDSRSG